MEVLVNKSVRFSKEQIKGLEEEAVRRNRKFGELVRIAVDQLLGFKNGKKKGRK